MNETQLDLFDYEDNFSQIEKIAVEAIFCTSEDDTPKFTIAIPTYKRVSLLKEALESAICQNTDISYDIIVVDNNPERGDDTELFMTSISCSKVSYYKNTQNIGMIGNWNRLYQLAKGEWVIMLHDDDVLYENYLSVISQFIFSMKNKVDAVSPTYTSTFNHSIYTSNFNYFKLCLNDFLMYNVVGAPLGFCVKKKVIKELGGFSSRFYPSSDYHLFIRLTQRYGFYKILNVLAFYRVLANESLKPETYLAFGIVDNKMKKYLMKNLNFISKFLWKEYLKSDEAARGREGMRLYKDLKEQIDARINQETRLSSIIRYLLNGKFVLMVRLFRKKTFSLT